MLNWMRNEWSEKGTIEKSFWGTMLFALSPAAAIMFFVAMRK